MELDFGSSFTERTGRVVQAAKLHRSAARKKVNRFLAEGENAVDAAVATGAARDVFVTEQAAARAPELLVAARHMGCFVHPISDAAARLLAGTVTTPGVFAVCDAVLWRLPQILRGGPRLVAVPVGTSDPGNAGTLIRVADAVGADAVVFAGNTVDPQGPKAVRASAGSLFHIPVAREADAQQVVDRLRGAGLQIVATTAAGERDLDGMGALLARPTAWLFGNEAHGLPEELLGQADYQVRIPIRGRAESLNLATAASICLYESAKTLYSQLETSRL